MCRYAVKNSPGPSTQLGPVRDPRTGSGTPAKGLPGLVDDGQFGVGGNDCKLLLQGIKPR